MLSLAPCETSVFESLDHSNKFGFCQAQLREGYVHCDKNIGMLRADIHTCMYVCMYVGICICICICIYTHIGRNNW